LNLKIWNNPNHLNTMKTCSNMIHVTSPEEGGMSSSQEDKDDLMP
jgi:hypothetical protein